MPIARQLKNSASQDSSPVEGHASWHHPFRYSAIPAERFFDCMEASVSIQSKKSLAKTRLFAEEEGIEPPLTVLETAALPLYYSSID